MILFDKEYNIKRFYLIKENIEKSIVIKSSRETITQFGKVEMLIGCKGTLIVGPIPFNIFFNDFFYVILIASAHNYVDDNTLASFGKTLEDLIKY